MTAIRELEKSLDPKTSHDPDTLLPDSEIIHMVQAGNPEAFGYIYERYFGRLVVYVRHRVGNHHTAEDIAQQVLMSAFVAIDRYKNRGLPYSSFLFRSAHNAVANHYRGKSKGIVVSLDDDRDVELWDGETSPNLVVENDPEYLELRAVIKRLSPERQLLLKRYYVDGLNHRETAELMGKSEGAIKSLMHRTMVELRGILAEK